MNSHKQPERRQSQLRAYLLAVFAMMILLGLPDGVFAQSQWTTNGNNINNTNTGNVGIGTTSPATPLHVLSNNGNVLIGNIAPNYGAIGFQSTLTLNNYALTGSPTETVLNTPTGTSLNLRVNNSLTNTLVLNSSGNIGIGTSTPTYRLHITGDNTSGGGYPIIKLQNTQAGGHSHWLYSGANGAAGDFGLFDETDSAYRFYVKGTSGNFGIGTTNPGGLLHVNSSSNPSSGQFRISANNTGSLSGIAYAPNNVALGFDADYASGAWIARDTSVAALYKTSSKFFIQGSGANSVGGAATLNSFLTVDLSNGNVGIGTTTPTAKLNVVGDIVVTGTINAKYQDVAEWVPALHNLPAGTVVVLNPTQSNQVMASAQAYDTRVAGVVSEKPGLTLGEAGADKVLVATTGRVKVKVDATRAAIRVGDLLVTSDQEGVAMKSEPLSLGGTPIHRPGTLIGKALEPLEKGRGEILVLLSLQ